MNTLADISDISTTYRFKTNISVIYRIYYRIFTDFFLKQLSITDIVSNIIDIRYIDQYIVDISIDI